MKNLLLIAVLVLAASAPAIDITVIQGTDIVDYQVLNSNYAALKQAGEDLQDATNALNTAIADLPIDDLIEIAQAHQTAITNLQAVTNYQAGQIAALNAATNAHQEAIDSLVSASNAHQVAIAQLNEATNQHQAAIGQLQKEATNALMSVVLVDSQTTNKMLLTISGLAYKPRGCVIVALIDGSVNCSMSTIDSAGLTQGTAMAYDGAWRHMINAYYIYPVVGKDCRQSWVAWTTNGAIFTNSTTAGISTNTIKVKYTFWK